MFFICQMSKADPVLWEETAQYLITHALDGLRLSSRRSLLTRDKYPTSPAEFAEG